MQDCSNECTIINLQTIYIYIDEPRTRYVKYLNYRLRFDTVSNESNAFDLRRTKTSQKCSFFSINNDSSKNHENRFRSISITFHDIIIFIIIIIITQSILGQLSSPFTFLLELVIYVVPMIEFHFTVRYREI